MRSSKAPSYLMPLLLYGAGGLAAIVAAGWFLRSYFSPQTMPLLGAVLAGFASVTVFAIGRIADLLREDAARRHRIADIVTAIYAELTASDFSADLQASKESEDYALEMVNPDGGTGTGSPDTDIPFAVPDESNFVFKALSNDLSLLPQEIIHPIVLYYKLNLQTNHYVRTLENPIFRSLSPERRAKFIADLVGLNRAQSEQGDYALAAIRSFARKAAIALPEAEETKRRLEAARTSSLVHENADVKGNGP